MSTYKQYPSDNRQRHSLLLPPSRIKGHVTSLHRDLPRITFFSEPTGAKFSDSLENLRITGTDTLVSLFEKKKQENVDGTGQPDQTSSAALFPFWLDISCPTKEDLSVMSGFLPFHPLTMEDILENDPREKCELFDTYLFVVFRTCDQDITSGSFLDPCCIYVALFDSRCVVTLHDRPLLHVGRVLKRLDPPPSMVSMVSSNSATIQSLPSYISSSSIVSSSESTNSYTGQSPQASHASPGTIAIASSASPPHFLHPDWVLYAILDDVVDGFMPLTKTMELEVDSIDDLVLLLTEADKSDMIRRIGLARKRAISLLRLLFPKRDLIKGLVLRHPDKFRASTMIYLRDIQDHVYSLCLSLEHFMETLNTSHANYLAQISIELTEASNRMNEVVKKLTVAAAVFLPLTLYAGVMGMNIPLPLQPSVGFKDLGPFSIVMLSMSLFSLLFGYIAWRFKML